MPSDKRQSRLVASLAVIAVICAVLLPCKSGAADDNSLWGVYEQALKGAKYVDLTHTITPNIPVWAGFADSTFAPAKAGADIEGFAKTGEVYTYAKHGFEATEYTLRTDQLGTQLNPPAHWAPEYPAIDELPATYAIRPLVVISIVEQLKTNRTTPSRCPTSRRGKRSMAAYRRAPLSSCAPIGRRRGLIASLPP